MILDVHAVNAVCSRREHGIVHRVNITAWRRGLFPVADEHSQQSDAAITLGVLRAVDQDEKLTQRSVAQELGVALGLVNTYFKRCMKKGLIKVRQAPANRYAYYLTPKGFAEKSRLTAEYLSQSLSLFRQAQRDYADLIEQCERRGWRRIALCGASDLAELFILHARDHDIEVVGILDPDADESFLHEVPVAPRIESLDTIDAWVVTSLTEPQFTFEEMARTVTPERVLTPALLEINRSRLPGNGGRR